MSCSITYQLSDGKLLEYSRPASPGSASPGIGKLVFEEDISTDTLYSHYCVDGELTERPAMPITGGSSVVVDAVWRIDGIPEGATLVYPDGELIIDDGFVEWSSAVPGNFPFKLSLFPYLDLTINAVISPT